ncbi:MAG: methyltransferase domain-containing protein, partial [Nitrososphaeria archaeon]
MKVWMLNVLVCPQCLGRLKLRIFETDLKGEIIRGRIFCQACKLNFVIENGVPVFGISAEKKTERYQELDSELKWEFSVDMQSHIKWAKKSAITGERIIQKIKKVLKITSGGGLTVLDVGAGCGALHSWQFSKHGFQVVAAELCPEFLFSIDYFKDENLFFERVVTDCSILPFRESSFDIVFCKQLIHHIEDP